MADALGTFLPLLALMLLAIWPPIIGAVAGVIADRFRPERVAPGRVAVDAAKARSAEVRTALAAVAAPAVEVEAEVEEPLAA